MCPTCPGGEANHRLAMPPKVYVILECQEVKEQLQNKSNPLREVEGREGGREGWSWGGREVLTWKKDMKIVSSSNVRLVSRKMPFTSSNSFSVNPVPVRLVI